MSASSFVFERLEVSAGLRVIGDEKTLRRFEQHQTAFVHEPDASPEDQCFAHVVSYEDRSLSQTRSEICKFTLQTRAREWIKRAKRFVKQKQRRIGAERARHTDALALTA